MLHAKFYMHNSSSVRSSIRSSVRPFVRFYLCFTVFFLSQWHPLQAITTTLRLPISTLALRYFLHTEPQQKQNSEGGILSNIIISFLNTVPVPGTFLHISSRALTRGLIKWDLKNKIFLTELPLLNIRSECQNTTLHLNKNFT